MFEDSEIDALVQEVYAPDASREAPNEGVIDGPEPSINDMDQKEDGDSSTENSNGSNTTDGTKIKYKGKEIDVNHPKYVDFAQKGYDYEQKMHQFRIDSKLKEQEYSQKAAALKELEEINEYAKTNPAFEQLIQREWAKVQAGEEIQVDPQDKVQLIEAKLNQLMDKLGSQEQQLEARRIAELEATQEGAIAKYKEDHTDFDWNKEDDEGLTLEDRIGQAMIDNGVRDFQIMADSFLIKEQLTRKTLEGKEAAAREIQKANKLGLGRVTKQSQLQTKKAEDVSNKSYDELLLEGLAELGIE